MRVILQQDVANLGKVGDQVSVRAGFGRNYLLPQGIALIATPKNIAEFEARRSELEQAAAAVLTDANERAAKVTELEIVISAQAGDEGKLFGSVGARDIAEAITEKGIKVEKKEVILTEGAIRQTGEYTITLKLHSAVSVPVKIKVVGEART